MSEMLSKLPDVEMGHVLRYDWGDIRVSAAAAEAYGLEASGEPSPGLSYSPEELYVPPPQVSVWVLSPDENLAYSRSSDDQMFPKKSVTIIDEGQATYFIAGLDQTRFAASRDAFENFSKGLRATMSSQGIDGVDEHLIRQGVFIGPHGKISTTESMSILARTNLHETLCLMVHRSIAEFYDDFAKTKHEKQAMRALTAIGMLSMVCAGAQVELSTLLHETGFDEAMLAGAGATVVAGSVKGRRMLRNFFENRRSREQVIAQSAGRFALVVSAALHQAYVRAEDS